MSRAGVPLAVWAAFLTVLATVLAFWEHDNVPKVIFFASAALMWVVALYALVRGRRLVRTRVTPDLSYPAVFVALAIAMLALGALVGLWLVLIGVGALVIGLAGVGRELAAQRRAASS